MNPLEKIQNDLKEALKNRDDLKVSVLRMLIAALKNERISRKEDLKEEEVIEVIQKQVKMRKQAIVEYDKAGRQELKQKEEAELILLQEYLPKALGNEELQKIIEEVIIVLKAESLKDMGRVMGVVMDKVKGQAEGGQVLEMVKEKLSSK